MSNEANHVYCKFAHNATLQGQANRVRIHWKDRLGVEIEPYGFQDYQLEPMDFIVSAINVRESVVILHTTRNVYEVSAEDGAVHFTRIGPALTSKQQDARGYRIRDVA